MRSTNVPMFKKSDKCTRVILRRIVMKIDILIPLSSTVNKHIIYFFEIFVNTSNIIYSGFLKRYVLDWLSEVLSSGSNTVLDTVYVCNLLGIKALPLLL